MFFLKNYTHCIKPDVKLYEELLRHDLVIQTLNEPEQFIAKIKMYRTYSKNGKHILKKMCDKLHLRSSTSTLLSLYTSCRTNKIYIDSIIIIISTILII